MRSPAVTTFIAIFVAAGTPARAQTPRPKAEPHSDEGSKPRAKPHSDAGGTPEAEPHSGEGGKPKAGPHSKEAGKQKAERHFKKGSEYFRTQEYKKAIEQFEIAYRIWPHRSLIYGIALAHAFLKNVVVSGRYVRRYLKVAKPHERKLPPILQRIIQQTGVLIVRPGRPDALVYVDGRKAGTGWVKRVTLAGKHAVDIRLGRLFVTRKLLEVPPGGKVEWNVPPKTFLIPRGRTDGGQGGAGGVKRVPAPGTRDRGRSRYSRLHWAYFASAAALTCAALGTAIGLSVRMDQVYDDYVAGGRTNDGLRDKGIAYMNARDAMWAVTAAVAAGAVALSIFTRWRKPTKETRETAVAPSVSPAGVGMTLAW